MNTTHTSGLPERYPIVCPHCTAVAGIPVAVMTVVDEPRALRLDFKCSACHHRWWQQFMNQFVVAPPKPDAIDDVPRQDAHDSSSA